MDFARLDPGHREAAWQRLESDEFDVVVIGGGVTGAGAALDAATRGLSVALIEARDWASGTSSRSSKLFHGGLRYLEQFEFGLVREALRERELMTTRLAPHLVKPVPFLYPLTHRGWERPYVAAGLALYDTIGGHSSVPGQKHLSRRAALRMFPGLKDDAFVGAVRYYDAQADDARHTLTVARTAARYGAVVRSSTEAVGFVRESDRVVGVRLRDAEDGRETSVAAGVVLNCTGVWTDEIQALSGGRGRFRVRASKGVHIVVARERITGDTGLILRTPTSVLFVIPWKNHWLIGTTDTDWNLDLAHPAATKSDIDYLLDTVNEVLVSPLTPADISGVYAGLRPLLAGESEETSALSREHAVARVVPGLISIAGGKYTTYRVMAADAVDAGADELLKRVAPSCTDKVPLLGADGFFAMQNQVEALAAEYGLHPHRIRHLLDRYGSLLRDVLRPGLTDAALLETVPEAPDYLMAEIRYAVTDEGALHLEDVLTRRTRISIEYPHRGVDCAPAVAGLVADLLGWDDTMRTSEIVNYTARVEAERASQSRLDDQAADQVRTAAPQVRRYLRADVSPGRRSTS
ncbi:MAG TPA: glycerol-3-phosphate dehydrogenase/oxidase [Jatrophihabitans sp.]|uniref:glycerol-3-phosphate dehydrogenase/oxidase n=1 Tax=Jatrophihabitans sp. TaxID=1932789 RepID=UPI002E018D85|nr:glycerol-3-phosphate dehydrogenase/oxidase [Jatrophihabitans sp.]